MRKSTSMTTCMTTSMNITYATRCYFIGISGKVVYFGDVMKYSQVIGCYASSSISDTLIYFPSNIVPSTSKKVWEF